MSDRNSADISQSYSGLGRLASKFDNSPSKLTAGLHEDDYQNLLDEEARRFGEEGSFKRKES